jgi:hypothetical protein
MPARQEDALRKAAKKLASKGKLRRQKGDSLSEAVDRFVYGTMRNQSNWKPSREKK